MSQLISETEAYIDALNRENDNLQAEIKAVREASFNRISQLEHDCARADVTIADLRRDARLAEMQHSQIVEAFDKAVLKLKAEIYDLTHLPVVPAGSSED